MLVAVTLSLAGNQAADTAGGAEVTTILGIPLRMAPIWARIVKVSSSIPGYIRKVHLIEVASATNELDNNTADLRL